MTDQLATVTAQAEKAMRNSIESAFFMGQLSQLRWDQLVIEAAARQGVDPARAVGGAVHHLSQENMDWVMAEFEKTGMKR